jgi:hypothetical protein
LLAKKELERLKSRTMPANSSEDKAAQQKLDICMVRIIFHFLSTFSITTKLSGFLLAPRAKKTSVIACCQNVFIVSNFRLQN